MSLLLLQSPPLPAAAFLFFIQSRPPTARRVRFSPKTLPTRPLSLPRRRRPPAALPIDDQDLLNALTNSLEGEGGARTHLPAVRSYENDLSSLTLIGAVGSDQALTAAAADGGDAADEHLSSGTPTMVVETVFPGFHDDHSTVSTRLFLPARKVKEKAKKLRSSLTADILSSNASVSKNILAMTFRQVVVQRLWSFKLSMFSPGTQRTMDNLTSPRNDPTDFTVSSSDRSFLSALAEVVCSCALERNARSWLGNAGDSPLSSVLSWFQRPQGISSADSAVCVHRISQADVVKSARRQVDLFNQEKDKPMGQRRVKHRWWAPPIYPMLDKAGGPGFSDWTNEFIPAYRLQIDTITFKDVNLEGWKKLDDNRWEVLLTHFQMVELASILDIYYEDQYTLPDKQLLCNVIIETSDISKSKDSSWKMLFISLAGGCVLIFAIALAQLWWPHLRFRKSPQKGSLLLSSETDSCLLQSPESTELVDLCSSIVERIKDELGWSEHIMVDTNIGAWIGILPSFLRNKDFILDDTAGNGEHASVYDDGDLQPGRELSVDTPMGTNNKDMDAAAQHIASYQVVLSGDGRIVGFQPTSRVAVNHWASNPLTKALYGGRKLSPGLFEPSLKIPEPRGVVLIELLMSVDPKSCFAFARPAQLSHEEIR